MALLAAGSLVLAAGVVLAVRDVLAALDDRPFTITLGGLVGGFGAGVIAVALALDDRPPGWLTAAVMVLATFSGYLAGAILDYVLR